MIEVWFFTWLLVGAGFQVSPTYTSQAYCESARAMMNGSKLTPQGLRVERTYACQRAQ